MYTPVYIYIYTYITKIMPPIIYSDFFVSPRPTQVKNILTVNTKLAICLTALLVGSLLCIYSLVESRLRNWKIFSFGVYSTKKT